MPTGLPDPLADEPAAPRKTRFLPLSGKSEAALRDLAGRYLGWLEELSDGPRSGSELESLLSDLAWTAGIGRSHFGHRAGVVFRDRESLREGLRALADHDGQRAAETAGEVTPKVAFAFPGHVGDQLAMSEQLYESESVARAVLDRCDEVFREDCGESLLEGLFGRARTAADAADPTWRGPAIYALQCALVTLWAGVGVRPQAAVGWGIGELAAARAAGVFGLEDGLRLAAWSASADGPDGAVRGTPPGELELAPPSVTLISPTTGRALSAGEVTNAGYWRRRNRTAAGRECSAVLSALDAQLTLEMDAGGSAGFAAMVAEAYEAGVHIDFAGLFAGETRRRISLPGYPFQRRRFWISEPQLQV